MIGGVAGGIAEYFDIDPVIVRIIFVCALFFGAGILAYILLWIIIPEEPFTLESESTSNQSTTSGQKNTIENETENNEHKHDGNKRTSYIFGGVLVVLGVILLFSNLISFDAFWPLIFIALGAALLLKSRNK